MKVVIVGAGIAGLSLGLSLARRGISCQILEQAAELTEVGAGLQISPNASKILHQLGLSKDLEQHACCPEYGTLRTGKGNRLLAKFRQNKLASKKGWTPYYQVHRADLLTSLIAAIKRSNQGVQAEKQHPYIDICLNEKVIQIDEQSNDKCWLTTAQGHSYSADLVVAADGIHSSIADYLAKQQAQQLTPNYMGAYAWRALIPAEVLTRNKLAQVKKTAVIDCSNTNIWLGRQRHLVAYPVSSGRYINLVGCVSHSEPMDESWSKTGAVQQFRNDFADFNAEVQLLLSCVKETHCWGLYQRDILPRWYSNRCVLMGDAAHAMLPSMAQGAACAIEDADELAQQLQRSLNGELTTIDALYQYQVRRYHRTKCIQKVARNNLKFFHGTGLLPSIGHWMMSICPLLTGKIVEHKYHWVYKY